MQGASPRAWPPLYFWQANAQPSATYNFRENGTDWISGAGSAMSSAIRNIQGKSGRPPIENKWGGYGMKRRQFLQAAGLGVAGSAIAAPAIAQSMPELKWRLTASWPKSLDTLWGGVELMAKLVGEATDNKFQVQAFAGGEIVPGLQVLDAVQNGTVEMGHTASYYYFGKDPTFAFGTAVPFGPNQRLNQAWYMLGGGKDLLNQFYKGYNVTSFLAGNTGCQMGGWFRKEINTVDDLKGLKMRIGGFAGRVMQKLGVVPSRLPAATSIPRWKKARSTPQNGSVLTTTRNSASIKSRRTTIYPAGGKAARCCWRSSI